AGNDTIFEFTYKAPKVSVTPDSLMMMNTIIGSQQCSQFVFRNTSAPGGNPMTPSDVHLFFNKGDFTIQSIQPSLPAVLNAGDSIVVQVCYVAKDTGIVHVDSVVFETGCFP